MRDDVARWFVERSSRSADWPVDLLLAAKGATSVSVVIPALDEEATVGAVVAAIHDGLVDVPRPLVDELVVVDSFSTDATAAVAARAGARVVGLDEVLGNLPTVPGKGEALWRGLAATTGDVVVFVDADLLAFEASTVTGLLGPLLTDPGVQLVKATYDRPLADGARVHPAGGGRVTELVARPLLNLHWPQLAGFVQPLAGEYAARRPLLERLPFPTGYGVELGLLVDAVELVGLDALAQVDLGVRRHRHHGDQRLGRMAAEIWQTALARLDRHRAGHPADPSLVQFERDGDTYLWSSHDVTALERPPLVGLARGARAS
jgi:glucosyl-3-phosphoglycerate synthase